MTYSEIVLEIADDIFGRTEDPDQIEGNVNRYMERLAKDVQERVEDLLSLDEELNEESL